MQKIQQNSRLLLRGANGRIYGELVNRVFYKRVFASRHFLRKPPLSWRTVLCPPESWRGGQATPHLPCACPPRRRR